MEALLKDAHIWCTTLLPFNNNFFLHAKAYLFTLLKILSPVKSEKEIKAELPTTAKLSEVIFRKVYVENFNTSNIIVIKKLTFLDWVFPILIFY